MNRVRAMGTWVCIIGFKAANITSPLFLSHAINELTVILSESDKELSQYFIMSVFMYSASTFISKSFKELQSIIYIKVQQAAYVEIADNTFAHSHNLSLDWHLTKKSGGVVRSITRGIQAAQQLMQLVVLNLLPTIVECVAVCFISCFISRISNSPFPCLSC